MKNKVLTLLDISGVLIIYYIGAGLLLFSGMDSITATVCLNVLIATFIVIWWKLHPEYRIKPLSFSGNFVIFLGIFLVMFVLGQFTGTMVQKIFGSGAFANYQHAMQSNASVAVLLSFIVAPVAEECLVRGFIYQKLRLSFGLWFAWVLQAVIFAFMHGTMVHVVPTFLTALFLGLVYERTGNLRWPIFFHIVYNISAAIMGGLSIPNAFFTPYVLVPLDIACVAMMFFMFKAVVDMKNRVVYSSTVSLEPICKAVLVTRPIERREEVHDGSEESEEKENN